MFANGSRGVYFPFALNPRWILERGGYAISPVLVIVPHMSCRPTAASALRA